MVVQLNLREAKLNQVVDAAPIVSTGLVIPDQNRNVLIPSVFLTGTRFLVVAGARQSFNISNASYDQTISASSPSSLGLAKGIALARAIVLTTAMTKILAIAVTKAISSSSAATMFKDIGKTLSATLSSLVTQARGLSQSVVISVSQASTLTLTKMYSVGQTISATLSSSVTLGKVMALSRAISATLSNSTTLVKSLAKTIATTASSSLSLVKDLAKSLAFNLASSLAVTKAIGLFSTISASVSPALGLAKGIGKSINLAASSAMSLAKAIALVISASVSTFVSTSLGRLKIISATVSSNLTLQSVITRLVFEITNIIYAMALVRKIILPAPDRLAEAEEDRTLAATDLGRIISRASQTRKIYFVRNSVVRNQFSPKVANETQYFTFNFGAVLATGETISSATVSYSAPPGSFVNSNTLVLTGSPIIEGSDVSQLIGAGRSLDVYILTCRIVTSSGQSFDLSGTLNIT